ncbi:FumA C-terminus/TtdB family hydratase beta subunit [Oscillospiraceae bacterium OttesenSCG-928-F05]|nr:FumA C-terminus/TtdB family hydratase beta subunit [Oscillospiraceae bacterium OttesenSCG-928-F05]
MAVVYLNTETLEEQSAVLRAGDRVFLSGTVYTARDAAHKRLFDLLDADAPLPFPIAGSVIYYAGPTPPRGGMPTGSCGPTTSGRMDTFTPRLIALGLKATIGKGARSRPVVDAMKRHGAVYLCAVGGAGALMATCITAMEEMAFPELGCESLKRLRVENMPLYTAIDTAGRSLYEEGPAAYRAASL